MENHIFSPGKLLITSEYFVLDGALALAVPTKLGQDFYWQEIEDGKSLVYWEALHEGKPWLLVVINYKNWEIVSTNLPESAAFVLKVLKNVQKLSETRFQSDATYKIRTNLQFPGNFGLGSSSTLMNNLAEFSNIDAFLLNEISLGGSGYDIAVAQEKSAILYQNNPRLIEKVEFKPKFAKDLILIHLNQKQDSREGIAAFRSREKSIYLRNLFSEITKKVLECEKIEDFSELMLLHERELSKFLNVKMIKDKCFKDCPSFVKSLGAWGGDFVLASKFGDYKKYFSHNNYHNVFDWESLVY